MGSGWEDPSGNVHSPQSHLSEGLKARGQLTAAPLVQEELPGCQGYIHVNYLSKTGLGEEIRSMHYFV